MAVDEFGGTHAKLMTRRVSRHLSYVFRYQTHGVSPIAHQGVMATGCLRCGTIDHGNKIICNDDSVLAFPRGALRNDALLYYFHS